MMGELHGFTWIGVGIFIAGVSIFLGFFSDNKYPGFFRIMTFVGFVMIGFGYLKLKRMKSPQQIIEERRQQRGPHQIDIETNHQFHGTHAKTNSQVHHQTSHPAHSKASYCHQCGSPLLKHHKFCPVCGSRV